MLPFLGRPLWPRPVRSHRDAGSSQPWKLVSGFLLGAEPDIHSQYRAFRPSQKIE